MEKIKFFILLCLFGMVSMGASAYDFEATNSDGKIIYYYITSSSSTDLTCEVTFYSQGFDNRNHYLGDISVPSSVTNNGKTYIVTGIGHEAFDGCSGMRSIIIPNTVESIGQSAFHECTGLTSITIPSSVKSIGRWAFLGCKGLTKVDIADINKWAEIDFYDSSANPLDYAKNLFLNGEIVKEATLTSATKIGNYAFVNCTCMESITIPNSVSKIGSGAFNGCSGITSITIPNSVLNIGRDAFDGCSGITSITIPNSILSIENGAFSNCSGLTEVTLNSNSIVSKDYTYLGLLSIFGGQVQNYIIGDAVKSIGNSAFRRCNIKSVTISNSVTSIGEGAFLECSKLTSILIPKSCINIGKKAFVGCHNLAAIEVDNDNPNYNSHINCNAIIETATNTLVVGCKNTIIPNNVTIIGESAFYGCDGLTAINIPEGVTSIGESAFYECTGLTKVAIPISVADIGNRAFDGCSDLRSLIVYWKRPISITSDVFNNIDKTSCTLFVPEGSWSIYCTTSIWSDFTNIEETRIATSISLNSSTANLTIGTTATLTATVLPDDATDKSVTWSSDNESVATVADGVVTAVAVGTANITATTNDGSNLSATCEITVEQAASNLLFMDSVKVSAGKQVVLPVYLDNIESVCGFQFDIELPEGFSIATSGRKATYVISAGTERFAGLDHTVTSQLQSDGSVRVLCSSITNANINDDCKDTPVINITINVDASVAPADYMVKLKNITLARFVDAPIEVNLPDAYSTITVLNAFPVTATSSNEAWGTAEITGDNYDSETGNAVIGTDVTLTATPASGFAFVNWTENGGEVSAENPLTFTVSGERNLVAVFTMLGDVYENNVVNVTDLSATVGIILNRTTPTRREYVAANIDNDDKIDVADYSNIAAIILNGGVSAAKSDDFTKYVINMQYDMHIPVGLNMNADDIATALRQTALAKNHSIVTRELENGDIRVLVLSMQNEVIADAKAMLEEIAMPADKATGEYDVTLRNIVLSYSDLSKEETGMMNQRLMFTAPTGIEEIQGSKLQVQGSAYNLNGQKLQKARNGVNIIEGKKYIIK